MSRVRWGWSATGDPSMWGDPLTGGSGGQGDRFCFRVKAEVLGLVFTHEAPRGLWGVPRQAVPRLVQNTRPRRVKVMALRADEGMPYGGAGDGHHPTTPLRATPHV